MANNFSGFGGDFRELLTTDNSELLRRSVAPQFSLATGQGANVQVGGVPQILQSLQRPTGGNWNAPISYGSPIAGYTDRTSPSELAAAQMATQSALAAPSNQPAPLPVIDPYLQAEKTNPLLSTMSQEAILKAQLARDPSGTARKLLMSLSGASPVPPSAYPANDPYGGLESSRMAGSGLRAHIPTAGFGSTPSDDSMTSALDMEIVQHPEFQRLAQTEPDKAKHAYRAITGRDYEADVKNHQAVQKTRDTFENSVVGDLIKRGAYVDSATGKLMKWGQVEADPNAIGTSTAPSKQIIEASPDEQRIWDKRYSQFTGNARPNGMEAVKTKQYSNVIARLKDPEVQAAISEQEAQMSKASGRPVKLNADQQHRVAIDLLNARTQPGMVSRSMAKIAWPFQQFTSAAGQAGSDIKSIIESLIPNSAVGQPIPTVHNSVPEAYFNNANRQYDYQP